MKDLTTRKIVLGMLMAFVLAFSVQGIADAQTVTRSSGDLQTSVDDTTFEITIAVADLDGDDTLSIPNRTSGLVLQSIGSFNIPETYTSASITLYQTNPDTVNDGRPTLGASHALTYLGTSVGTKTITIGGTSFTVYVVKSSHVINFNDTVSLLSLTNGVSAGNSGRIKIHNGDGRNNPVIYTVTGGTGTAALTVQRGSDTNRTLPLASGTGVTSSNADVWLDLDDDSRTVSVNVQFSERVTRGVYIHGRANLNITAPTSDPPTISGDPGTVTITAITVQVQDQTATGGLGSGGPVNDVPVKFDVADKTATGGYLIPPTGAVIVDSNNNALMGRDIPTAARTLYVRTASDSASVGFQFGLVPGTSDITVSVAGRNVSISETVEATVTGKGTTQLSISSNRRRSGSDIFDLIASVTDEDGRPLHGVSVRFRTRFGALTNTPTNETDIANPFYDAAADTDSVGLNDVENMDDNVQQTDILEVKDITDRSGLAQVTYNLGNNTGRQEIDASIFDGDPDFDRQEITFVVNGPAQQRDDQPLTTPTNRLAISPTSITGDPGDTETITVTALNTANVAVPGVPVILSLPSAFTTAGGSASSTSGSTPFTSTLTLPNAGTHIITATAGGYSSASTTVTVTAPTGPGTLTLTLGARVGDQQAITVSATRGGSPRSGVRFTITGGLTSYAGVTDTTGSVTAIITLPTETGSHVLTVSATEYTTVRVTVPAAGQPGSTPPPTGPAGGADSIRVDGQRLRSGTVNEQLDAPLRVRVIDANGTGVANVRVTFRVLAPGRGTFPGARGSGRATQDETNRTGYVSANFTPTTEGNVTVRATAAGVSDPVTFIIDVGAATDTRAPDPGVTPSRKISPVVHVGAAQRPPMLWVDSGKIYALVGANVQEFGSGIEGAMNIAVGGGKVYWTEMTGASAGTINSANLNGSGVKELKSIQAVPMGIVVDTTNSKLYWTNSRGRIQSLNADGSGIIQNVMQNLPGPKDIAVARGNLYWTQYDATASAGNVGIVNPTGAQRIARYISTGSDSPMSLTISGSKVYWTEMTGTSAGTINSANLNGTGATQLASILAVPSGIGVDGSRSKLYWTNSRGRIQSANLNGSKIQNVVDGLGNPGDMVLNNSIKAPAAGETSSESGTTASKKYDVNGDGVVDGKDKVLVLDAIMAGTYSAKYDVNDDKKLDILDYVLVDVNIDAGTAGAPALLGMKMTAVEIDRLQEQIDLLIATGDRSPAAMRTLIYLQQLIVMARPEKTQLLANYPNPFNPETWIPYELATDTSVKITIYNTQGVVIRTLELGHQSAGYYTGRDRAAYWDGRNAFGEQVASGIYFYQFEADEMSLMRKMVILK
ncbi:hypothetical protein C6500_10880 [Candidatus Poribacteria bacterium]|nr:MAG: hypothetical protein C6500_10880 [Candidatus Poribacteria bacterium]